MALTGKVAVVTGAAQGIGKAVTEILLQNGVKVSFLDVNDAAGRAVKETLDKQFGAEKTLFFQCNVESEEQVKAALHKTVETFGGIDILCNNVGIMNEISWETCVSVNLVSLIRVTYLALDYMSEPAGGKGGVVVNIASMAGLYALPCTPVYTATKHGVIGFTRAMAKASSTLGYGVRFNAVCPWFVQTDLLTGFKDKLGRFVPLLDATQQVIAQGTLSTSQIALGCLELVADETKNDAVLQISIPGNEYLTLPELPGL
ncbi:15-hydroxyprostaglandin dehydrogenase [NAD(+)]-like [Nelusetta ayraudi]|uniref:15-hydroxyprostaglandin dehydrogenase [NAD(+)]-like n=1 Tax=Nelusetta ayraudi TaxID=303726 RepID=UPI003F716956